MKIGKSIQSQNIQDSVTKLLQDVWLLISIQKRTSEHKVSFTRQKCIGSLTQMTPSIYTWTSLGHLVTMLLQRHNPLIRELYLKHNQVPQKLIDNSGHMEIIGKCPILLLVTMTPIMMTMTQMLTLMSTKNGSKEEMDGTKQHEHLKKKRGSQIRLEASRPYPCMSRTLIILAKAYPEATLSPARPLPSHAKLIVICI